MPLAPRAAAWALRMANLPGPFAAQEALSLTFPSSSRLDCRVYAALGADLSQPWYTWSWTDITAYVRFNDGISVTDGRRDFAGRTGPGTGGMRLDNRDGRFARRNPLSPYFGLLSKNTPIWATVDAGTGAKTRMQQFVNEWPVRWDKSARDSTVPIATAGILRRLSQGARFKSALRRAVLGSGPAAYWPLEDESDSTQAAPGISRGLPLAVTGSVEFGATIYPAGATGAVDLSTSGARLSGSTGLAAGVSTQWELECLVAFSPFPTGNPVGNRYTVLQVETPGGTYPAWGVVLINDIPTPTTYNLGIYYTDTAGTVAADYSNSGPMVAGQVYHFRMSLTQAGSNIAFSIYIDGVLQLAHSFLTGTLYAPTFITLNASAGSADPESKPACMSHVAIWTTNRTAPVSYLAADGYVGELATTRLARVCGEEGIAYLATSSSTVAMGAQPLATALEILRECEDAEGGTLYEVNWGLGYQSTLDRYNAPVAMTVDFDLGQVAEPPEPADDDQRTRNRWTVNRSFGSEYTAEKTTGPMGTGPEGPGLYDDQATVNVATDNQLPAQAGWRLHLGTVDEDRWPQIDLNFARAPALIDTWTALTYGSRVNFIHPPDDGPPDTIDAFIEGRFERWDTVVWRATLNTSPASPYDVYVVGDTTGNRGRVDAANSTLAADATSSDTTISVASPGALWRTGAVSFDINVAGERMTVTNISGGSSPQTFTVTRSVNGIVKAQSATVGGRSTKVSLWKPAVYAL